MKICVIGGANVDISARTAGLFVAGDSNPGTVNIAPGGVGRNIAHNLKLLGDKVRLITVFGDDGFGRMLRDHCKSIGLDISLSETVPGARNACFVSLNASDGELLGGVSDMAVTGLMTPEWLEARLDEINKADAVVADTNLPAPTLGLLVGCCEPPLYIDAVSSAKVPRLKEALSAIRRPGAGMVSVKCNRLEAEVLSNSGISGIDRLYVSLGSEGMEIHEGGEVTSVPPIPVTGIANTTGAGDALLAGIVHCGPDAPALEAADFAQKCARLALMSTSAVSDRMRDLA